MPTPDPNTYILSFADGAHRGGQRPMPPKAIIIHATGGTNSLAWLTTTSSPPVSAHFLIRRDGVVHRLVEDSGVAWHAGTGRFGLHTENTALDINDISIGIELENLNNGVQLYPAVQVRQAARVCWRLYQQWGHIPIVGHYQTAPGRKVDPLGFNWNVFRADLRLFMLGTIT